MSAHLNENVQEVGDKIASHMTAITSLFKPGMKITVVLRCPAVPDGSRDWLLSDDNPDEAIASILRQKDNKTGEVEG